MGFLRLAVLGSGFGSNCRAIYNAIQEGKLTAEIRVIISDHSDSGILEFAKARQIPAFSISHDQFHTKNEFHLSLLNAIQAYDTELIVLAGYLKKIGTPLIQNFPNKIINIHPALLPAFGGKGMYGKRVHQAVIDSGVKVSGITVHLVDEQYDQGPIVLQRTADVLDSDTPESLSAKILKLEHEWYFQAIQWMADSRCVIKGKKVIIN
jgi:phosphoribosylglycinamide formyltransferase 1